MANLLSWLGNSAKRVGNTVNNDVFQPINRDVVAPSLHVAAPLGNLAQATAQGAYHVGAIVPNEARSILGFATGNQAAGQNAFNQAGQGLNIVKQLAQGIPRQAIQLGESLNPSGGDVYQRQYTPPSALRFALGGTPIPTMQKQFQTTKQNGGVGRAAGEAGLTALMDALGAYSAGKSAVGASKQLPEVAAKVNNAAFSTGPRVPLDEQRALLDYADYKNGTYRPPASATNELIKGARVTGGKLGIDVTSGSPAQIAERIRTTIDNLESQKQGGYIKTPGKNGGALGPEEINALKKQGYDETTIAKMHGPQGEKISLPSATKVRPKSTYTAPLPSAETINPVTRGLASKTTLLRKINTPSSNALADIIQPNGHIQSLSETLRANAKNRMPATFSLNPEEFTNLGNVVEHGDKPLNARVAQAAQEAKQVFPDIHSAASSAKVKLGNIQNYFPRDYPNLKPGSPEYNTALQSLVKSGQAKDLTDAVGLLKSVGKGKGTNPSFFGNFDRPRLDIPGYNYTKEALQKYLNGAAQKTAETTHLGPKGEVVDRLVANIAKEGGDAKLAQKAVQNYLRSAGAGQADPLAPVRGVFGAARLGKAPVSHLGQMTNIPLETRFRDLPTAIGKALTKEGRDYITESDVNNPANIHGLAQQETSVKGALNKVTAAGLSPVMKMNRGLASLAGRDYGQYLASAGNEPELRGLGVTGDIGKTLTHEQELQASRGVANKTMFNPTRASTPLNAETPAGKTIGQYRTAYGYKQTGLVWNNVIKAAGQGDLRPLGKFLAVSAPVAGATILAKQGISGRKQGPGGVALDTAAALGGIPGELAVQAGRYAKGNILKTVAGAVAPVAGEAVDVGQRAQKAVGGDFKPLGKYATGLIPIAGGRISSGLFPSNAPTPVNPNTAPTSPAEAKAQSAKIKKDLENVKNTEGYDFQQLPNGHFAVRIGTNVTEKDTATEARKAIAEDVFKNSDSNIKTVGDIVYRKAADGTVTTTTKTKFDYQLGAARLVSQKNAGDLDGYIKTANSQLDSIQKQLLDPSTDPLDALTLQNDATTLQANIDKYKGYGGFTKPKAAKAPPSFKIASSKAPRISGIKVRTASAKFKAPTTRKLSVSKIPSSYTKQKLA